MVDTDRKGKKKGAGRAQGSGRATPKSSSERTHSSGRYTAPLPKSAKKSPKWMGPLILAILILGALTIILNYVQVLPGGPSNWYLLGGIVCIGLGFGIATRYR